MPAAKEEEEDIIITIPNVGKGKNVIFSENQIVSGGYWSSEKLVNCMGYYCFIFLIFFQPTHEGFPSK